MVTAPVLLLSPAAILSTTPALSVKSLALVPSPGDAETVIVASASSGRFDSAVTVLTSPSRTRLRHQAQYHLGRRILAVVVRDRHGPCTGRCSPASPGHCSRDRERLVRLVRQVVHSGDRQRLGAVERPRREGERRPAKRRPTGWREGNSQRHLFRSGASTFAARRVATPPFSKIRAGDTRRYRLCVVVLVDPQRSGVGIHPGVIRSHDHIERPNSGATDVVVQ